MRKLFLAGLSVLLCCAVLTGCGKPETPEDERPWAATGVVKETAEETETTRQEEMSTLASLDNSGVSITLPPGVTAQDVDTMQTVLWRAFFYHDCDFTAASTADVLPFLADSAVPWGLRYIYDTVDPAHTHGEYEQLSVETDPDPLSLFPDLYYRVDGSVMEFLLRDVFGVKPDETVQTDFAYCADGVWYFNSLATGLEGNETVLHAWQTLGENHYRLTAELLLAQNETEMTHEKSAFVEISLHEVDGLRVWQIMNIETFE